MFFSRLFNRKRQLRNSSKPESNHETEAADELFEGEEAEDTDDSSDYEKGYDSVAESSDQEVVYEVVEREIQPAKIICPDCGGITLEGLEFCDKCGGELL